MSEKRVNAMLTGNERNKRVQGAPKGNRNAERHGLFSRDWAKKDRRTVRYRLYAETKLALVNDKGGQDNISKAMEMAIDMISWDYVQDLKARAEIEGKKRWMRKGKLDPLLEYEMKISGRVFDGLRLIGLKRMPRQVPTLTEYLDNNYGQDNESDEKEQQEQHA